MTPIPDGGAPRGRLLAIVNPEAGQHGRPLFCEVLGLLRDRGRDLDVCATAARGDAEALARGADPARYAAVLAVGGDGTINEVINGLAGRPLPLGIVPLGTVNVLAREIGLGTPADARTIADTIGFGDVREVRLGRVSGRLFAVMAGIGFDARVVESVSLPLKRRVGRIAYGVAALRHLLGGSHLFEVAIDGAAARAAHVIVCKGKYYAGSFVAARRASVEAPSFEVVLFERPGPLALVDAVARLSTGRLDGAPGVRIVQARRVEIAGPAGEPVQADGDLVARLPAAFEIDDRPLRLIFPRGG